jgi:hypothetical protein
VIIEKEKLLELLNQGYTNEQLSAYFECGITTVKRAKSKYSLVGYKTNSKPLTPKQIQAITELVNNGKSLQQICRILGLSEYLLKKYVDKDLYARILTCSKEVFVSNLIKADISPVFNPTVESAYMCGVLQSDGFITSDNYIGITTKDRDFTAQFARFFSTPIREVEKNGNKYFACRFKDIRNVEKFKRITNIYPNKTYSPYRIPNWIKSSEVFMYAFMVGVFNGDGWVYKIKGRNACEIGIEQHILSKPFLLELNQYLGWNTYESDSTFRIHTKKTEAVQEFYTWYSNSEFALLRKVEVLDSIML